MTGFIDAAAIPGRLNGRGRIKAVLFDVDGTLYHQAPLRAAMALELAAAPFQTGRWRDSFVTARVLREYRNAHEELRRAGDGVTSVAREQLHMAAARACVSRDHAHAIVDEWMFRRPLRHLGRLRRPGLTAVLTRFAEAGLSLGVLSDYPAAGKLEALDLSRFFSLTLCTSDESVNALKPHPRGFLVACEAWGLSPEEVLYVGDRPEVDGTGAATAGLPCAIFGSGRLRHRHAARGGWVELREPAQLVACLGA